MRAHQPLHVDVLLSDEAIGKVSAALGALTLARHACVEAHGELNDAKLRLGVRTKMLGTGPKGYADDAREESNVIQHRMAS